MSEHLRFSPDILRRLGEELVPQIEQGIVELVRNSYDADAVSCRVELVGVDKLGGTLRIEDDGLGMDYDAIRSGWLILGRSNKPGRSLTALGRRPVGEKGLGRLAALRMGRRVTLSTRPASKPLTEYTLEIDWSKFEAISVVEDVALEVIEGSTKKPPGTSIEVTDLSVTFGRREVERLARALLLLADPFDDSQGFHPVLISPEFYDLEQRVRNAYFDDAVYYMHAELDKQGRSHVDVYDPRTKALRWSGQNADLSKTTYSTVASEFELWAFLLDGASFTNRRATVTEVRNWLEVIGGVHLYHRGLRVHPYGDSGHDWLDMNLLRTRNPELRPSTNTSIGRVIVPDPDQILTEKTDRTGFLESSAFSEMRRFAIDSLEWMARQRLDERETKKRKSKASTSSGITRARNRLRKEVDVLPPEQRSRVSQAVQSLETVRQRQEAILREDLQLYRTLASLGTTIAVFAHEAAKPVGQIKSMAHSIGRRGKRELGPAYHNVLETPVSIVLKSARALESYASFPLAMLRREKRRFGEVDINSVALDIIELFQPFLEDSKISCKARLDEGRPRVWGSVAALESILSNLITNAVNAFSQQQQAQLEREILVATQVSESSLLISVKDNGPGIIELPIEEIWLPGRTSIPGGTGLGLTIVRDAVTDLGGDVHAIANGELGGAEIVVTLPLMGVEG
ncbi:MAG: GHKL domain-containing protein [Chloroflexi bacterium]|nr:GHKL domain-containing protein [Chloroflexota bacterium]